MQCVSFDLNCFVVVFNMFGDIVIGFDRFCVFLSFRRVFVTFRICSVKFGSNRVCLHLFLYVLLVSKVFQKKNGRSVTL